jgi:hypothetical protein
VNSSVSYRKCRVSLVWRVVEVVVSVEAELDAVGALPVVILVGRDRGVGWSDTLRADLGSPSKSDLAEGEWDD